MFGHLLKIEFILNFKVQGHFGNYDSENGNFVVLHLKWFSMLIFFLQIFKRMDGVH